MPVHITLELDLLDNSFDYLAASLEYISKARRNQSRVSWKFAILNLTFAIELLLKERLRRENELLLYSDLNNYQPINRETKTVSWSTLIVRLKYVLGAEFEKKAGGRLELAQRLRNQMLHYDVQLNFPEVYHDFANLLNFFTDFFNFEISMGPEDTLHNHVPNSLWQENEDLSAAFVEEIVYYNNLFMRKELRDELIAEQNKTTLLIDEEEFQRVPYTLPAVFKNVPPESIEFVCHDCCAYPGQIHLLECDMEVCPKCGGQLISCGCNYQLPQ